MFLRLAVLMVVMFAFSVDRADAGCRCGHRVTKSRVFTKSRPRRSWLFKFERRVERSWDSVPGFEPQPAVESAPVEALQAPDPPAAVKTQVRVRTRTRWVRQRWEFRSRRGA